MGIANRLAIGTANWGHRYGLSNVQVSEDEQKRILDYCQSIGIDMIDTATAYDWDWTKVDSSFKVVVKVQEVDDMKRVMAVKPYCIMAHNRSFFDVLIAHTDQKVGISMYLPDESDNIIEVYADIIQIPYSVYNREFEEMLQYWNYLPEENVKLKKEIHVRSIFLQGCILKETDLKPPECLAFCLMNPYVDRVIIGADSLEQLKQTIEPLLALECYQKVDESIIDPRRWEHD